MTVDDDRFDTLARALVGGVSRRTVLEIGRRFRSGSVRARRVCLARRRPRRRRGARSGSAAVAAASWPTCGARRAGPTRRAAPSKKYVCAIPFGGAETDPEECCGEAGAPCEFPSDCCAGFTCPAGGGACQQEK